MNALNDLKKEKGHITNTRNIRTKRVMLDLL